MRLTVELGARSYPVAIGQLGDVGSEVAGVASGRCVVVTNDVVGPLYLDRVLSGIRERGCRADSIVIPDGEAQKTRDTWWAVVDGLLELGVDRRTAVVALGGGVTGDLAGFAAASVLRGLPFIQVPTTLLAMVDASVGGKTGFNTAGGKNLVGAFHQPSLVFAPLDTLATLSDAELRCGLGEVVKHAVLADAALFDRLGRDAGLVRGRDAKTLGELVRRCCEIKADVVRQDERERGLRAVLNCGHTVGHALERVLGFGQLRHGEAVGVGMVVEAWLAVVRGEATPNLPRRIAHLLTSLGLPSRLGDVDPVALVDATAMDKKRDRGILRVAYPVSVGEVRIAGIERAELLMAVKAAMESEES